MEGRLQAVGRHVDDLAGALSEFPSSRQRSLALTKLEECLMWAVTGRRRGRQSSGDWDDADDAEAVADVVWPLAGIR